MSCKLIVNADDLGILPAINSGIVQAHLDGIVTSASIMANGRAYRDAIEKIAAVPSLDIGVHLTLVEEKPILAAGEIPSLVDESGRFHNNAYRFLSRFVLGRIDLKEVEKELDAQVRRVVDSGIAISHLDSHQHLHTLPGIGGIVFSLAKEYGISAVRIPREQLKKDMFKVGGLKRLVELLAINTLSLTMNTPRSTVSAQLVGFYDGGHLDRCALEKIITGLKPGGVYELMCHPGNEQSQSPYEHWGYQPGEELSALTAPEIKEMIRNCQIELTTYSKLSENLPMRQKAQPYDGRV